MAIMSFSNPPDRRTLGRVAGALAVDEAFVEKDWYVVQAIRALLALGDADFTPVFSGGTSLLKGHGLIKRFSEDIDFKLSLSEEFLALSHHQQRRRLGDYRDRLTALWSELGFTDMEVEARSGNSFLQFEMSYPTKLGGHAALRPHILAELSAKPSALQPVSRSIASFVAQFRAAEPEVPAILCVDPVETAADKLSAFAWRSIARDRRHPDDDPTIVRHLHDLSALEAVATASADFPALLLEALRADTMRGQGAVQDLPPQERLMTMLDRVKRDPEYPAEYRQFVESMAFAGAGDIPDFEQAFAALERLCAMLAPEVA
ncbi:putative nucleotidyltransferase component of viral defense system [Sphingobium wenxiniae]|uniref:Nucleotidyltransferase AbiEii toxin of type IV toxin-antitoxin system n=1 Tax=Sphingobium wenxiniae (strain DSM 21828 / CGMCC 1.7748 / JZ-1) TaxID=595605 RepID=A0A562KA76_SPHWJ|nr:nucleotidyl transferase AbiEii/AbiGii toxin family protein [Sphingobium wenxiniae]MBB6192733.1 putative nucleotidyltransferase component of viral defense system [Sphingobium wenxiniae]TWH92184.1 nucleotidyltransferase AbiEii toxin of type IV toxin-antitoxin system [Sphingobium wenxiniae]SCW93860.1 Nucleotidyl transferase AbiEii toxin, Type IV TA system [Sphingobium faniae]